MMVCPVRMGRQELARDCIEEECAWWDEVEGRCMVVSLGRKMAVIGNWILMEKLLKQPLAPVR